jgi:hypothetical protein
MCGCNSGPVFLADLHAVAPLHVSQGSILGWILFALVLAIVVAGGMFLTARR